MKPLSNLPPGCTQAMIDDPPQPTIPRNPTPDQLSNLELVQLAGDAVEHAKPEQLTTMISLLCMGFPEQAERMAKRMVQEKIDAAFDVDDNELVPWARQWRRDNR